MFKNYGIEGGREFFSRGGRWPCSLSWVRTLSAAYSGMQLAGILHDPHSKVVNLLMFHRDASV